MFQQKEVILLYLFISFLFSCTKDVHINIPQPAAKLVVNCLFNPDSSWKVFVGKSKSLSDTVNVSVIKNANVTLSDETGNHIDLVYLDSGYYVSKKKPEAGIRYTIKVSAPGYNSVEATNSAPINKLSIASSQFDTVPILITPDNVFDNVKVNKLNLSINKTNHKSYCQFQFLAYNKNELYYYILTNKGLDKLKENPFMNNSTIEKLSILIGKPILSETKFREKINAIANGEPAYLTLVKYAERKSTQKHFANLFKLESIYSQQSPLYNVTGDYYSVFAEIKKPGIWENLLLYTSYDAFDPSNWWSDPINHGSRKDVEIWLDCFTLSNATYQFKTTYIKHQLNRGNPFAQPVQVYDNIKNGYGIFAGYQEERVKIY